MQVKHFLVFGQAVTKGIINISCGPTLTVPVNDEDIVENRKFNLIATINHSGYWARGYYTSFIKPTSLSWFHCNDASVVPLKRSSSK